MSCNFKHLIILYILTSYYCICREPQWNNLNELLYETLCDDQMLYFYKSLSWTTLQCCGNQNHVIKLVKLAWEILVKTSIFSWGKNDIQIWSHLNSHAFVPLKAVYNKGGGGSKSASIDLSCFRKLSLLFFTSNWKALSLSTLKTRFQRFQHTNVWRLFYETVFNRIYSARP